MEKYPECKATKWARPGTKAIIPDLKDIVALVGVDPQNYREAAHPIFATALGRDRMRQYHKIMHHLPKRRSVSAPYRGKTLARLMAMDIPRRTGWEPRPWVRPSPTSVHLYGVNTRDSEGDWPRLDADRQDQSFGQASSRG